jgi:hypothetical protein
MQWRDVLEVLVSGAELLGQALSGGRGRLMMDGNDKEDFTKCARRPLGRSCRRD